MNANDGEKNQIEGLDDCQLAGSRKNNPSHPELNNSDMVADSNLQNLKISTKKRGNDASDSGSVEIFSREASASKTTGLSPGVDVNFRGGDVLNKIGLGAETGPDPGLVNPTSVASHSERMRDWARELYEMNSSMREAVNYELHGVQSRAVPENMAAVADALRRFQIEIDTKIPPLQKQAHTRAVVGLNSIYVQTPEFRLRFLRAERFDIQKAAIRYCRGLDYLLEMFGEQALLRQLYLSDLSKEEERFLKRGQKQVIPTRDRFGRRLLSHIGFYNREFALETCTKVVTYLCFGVLAEDLTTQRNGVVSLCFLSSEIDDLRLVERESFLRFFGAVPLRWSGVHLCTPKSPVYNVLTGLLLAVMPQYMRQILRVHNGTTFENEYSLRCFGLPTEDIPRTSTGTVKTKYLNKWIKLRTSMDDHRRMMARNNYNMYYATPPSARAFPGIECPEINCVLFRLGGLASTHPGNVEFRLFLKEKLGEREQLKTLSQKDDYLHQIIEETARRGFRFLVFDENRYWYTEVTDYKALRKHIFQAQRDIGKRARARTSMQSNDSTTTAFTSLDGSSCGNQNCGTKRKSKRRNSAFN